MSKKSDKTSIPSAPNLKQSKKAFDPHSSSSKTALECKNVAFKYDDESDVYALNDVSFQINRGEYIAIIGHNGSGKSTLSKILMGIFNPIKGSVYIFGSEITKNNIIILRKHIGIVFQNPDNQFIGASVQDDIAFGLENRSIDPKLMPEIIDRVSKTVGMENFLKSEPLWLSGGQKQRVAIASVIALEPDIIIFDEATSMLDPRGQKEIKKIMHSLSVKNKKTIISITHDMNEIVNADRVLVLSDGKLVMFDTPEKIVENVKLLRSIELDVPFAYDIGLRLQAKGFKIKPALTEEELIKQICDLS